MPSLARPPMPFMWPIVYTGTTGYEFLKEVGRYNPASHAKKEKSFFKITRLPRSGQNIKGVIPNPRDDQLFIASWWTRVR